MYRSLSLKNPEKILVLALLTNQLLRFDWIANQKWGRVFGEKCFLFRFDCTQRIYLRSKWILYDCLLFWDKPRCKNQQKINQSLLDSFKKCRDKYFSLFP